MLIAALGNSRENSTELVVNLFRECREVDIDFHGLCTYVFFLNGFRMSTLDHWSIHIGFLEWQQTDADYMAFVAFGGREDRVDDFFVWDSGSGWDIVSYCSIFLSIWVSGSSIDLLVL